MVQFDQLYLVCIAGYFQNFSFNISLMNVHLLYTATFKIG